jgi:uncharacterized membrane protein YfcA
VLRRSLAAGIPATVVGALASRWVDAGALVVVTDLILIGLGARLLVTSLAERRAGAGGPASTEAPAAPAGPGATIAVGAVTGLAAGLLANSGGFLLAPLFVTVLGLAIKPALGTSLAVASVLAVPGTLVHLALGHLDLAVVLAFAAGSIPLSSLGARMALRTESARLHLVYAVALVVLGTAFLLGSHL